MAANLVPESRPARVVFRQGREHLRFDPPNLLLSTLKIAAVIAVVAIAERSTTFIDYDAPKRPVEFQPPNTLLTLLSQQVAVPPVVVQAPFNQEDWPNPLRSPVRDLTWTQTPEVIPQVQLPAIPAPFTQEDWPNPLRPWIRDLTWTQTAQLQTPSAVSVVPSPFVQLDWANPTRLGFRELTWLQSPQVPQVVPSVAGSVFPFSLIDWPNPVLRTPFKESGWIDFANIGDIPSAAPVVPVPPVPTEEVKPSGGRVDHEFQYAIEGRRTYVQKFRDLRIAQEAAEVIEQVALQQAATLEVVEAKNARALKRALRLAHVEDDARYLELLAERRELAKNEEIGALLYKTFQDEEDILALLMIAAQLL